MMAAKENQHTVSRFLLRQFTPEVGDKVLWQISKTDCSRAVRKSPEKAATEAHFYSAQRDDGSWDHAIEDTIGDYENKAAPAIRRLIDNGHAVAVDRLHISEFIGLMYLRSKEMRDHALAQAAKMRTPEATIQFIERDIQHYTERYDIREVRRFIEKVKERGEGISMPRNFHLDGLFERATKWGAEINKLSWTIWQARPPDFFVISDSPVFTRSAFNLFTPGIVGLKRRDLGAELGFPLSSHRFLIAKPVRAQASKCGGRTQYDCKTQWCGEAAVRDFNLRPVLSAYEFIFSVENCNEIRGLIEAHREFRLKHPEI